MKAAALDHLVMPTADLAVARDRLSRIGFTVAPEGVHPFGTHNCCVYFQGGTFLEPLAVRDAAIVGDSAARGNVFVARDGAYRALRGDEGLSAIVLATPYAAGDDRQLNALHLSAGEMLTFSRPFIDAAGTGGTATFRLAFGAAPAVSDGFFFTCERVGVPAVDRSALERHDNGVTGIAAVTLAGDAGAGLLGAMTRFLGTTGDLDLGATRVRHLSPAALESTYGIIPAPDDPPLVAVDLRIASLEGLSALLRDRAVESRRIGARLVLPPAPGQGVHFAFMEAA